MAKAGTCQLTVIRVSLDLDWPIVGPMSAVHRVEAWVNLFPV